METKVVRESMNSLILGPSQANLLYKSHDICPSFINQFFKLQAFPAIMYLFLKLEINKVPVN